MFCELVVSAVLIGLALAQSATYLTVSPYPLSLPPALLSCIYLV